MNETLQKAARKTAKALDRKRRDPRFAQVIGKLVDMGLIEINFKSVSGYRGKINLEDTLWAGQIEPRVLELLPALVLKRPGIFRGTLTLPPDLEKVISAIRHNETLVPFRDVAPKDYMQWIPEVGHRGKHPSLLKTFRFTQCDLESLRRLQTAINADTEIQTLRYALNTALSKSTSNLGSPT
ncbi:MAG: hypothetical protein H6714_00450 [Myxococcales bacterium]|nr:hypothetical protein [Myxococcales bacterium]